MVVPERHNEDCVQVVKKVASDRGINLQDKEISTAHRLKSQSKRDNPIVIRFVRMETKINIPSKKKQKKQNPGGAFLTISPDIEPVWTH